VKKEKDNKDLKAPGAAVAAEEMKKEKFYTNPWLVLVAAILLVALIVGIFVGIEMDGLSMTLGELFVDEYARGDLWAALWNKVPLPIDYLDADLSNFIEFDSDKYKNYEVTIEVPPLSDAEINDDLIRLLSSKRGSADGDYKYDLSGEIRPGDVVYFHYVAYEYGEDGERIEIPFLNNLTVKNDDLKYQGGLRVGSLFGLNEIYLPGFESSLVGVIPENYQCDFKVSTGGALLDGDNSGDVAYVTATFVKENDGRIYENYPLRIELGGEDTENKWGEGILEYLSEKQIGVANNSPITLNAVTKDKDGNEAEERITFVSSTVNYVTRGCEDESVLTVETFFPHDYEDKEYRNKKIFVDVFFLGVTSYENAELNDEFITEKLEIKAERLESYEGETLVERFKNYRKESLTKARDAAIKTASEDAVWEYLRENIDVKKYPRREITRIYEDYYYAIYTAFASSQQEGDIGDDIDAFAKDYLGLSEDDNWYEHIMKRAENDVKEKLIFYTIIKMEDLIPTDEEYAALYRSELEENFEYYTGKTVEDYSDPAEYEKALKSYENAMLAEEGERAFRDVVYYYYATDTILSYATVKNTFGSN